MYHSPVLQRSPTEEDDRLRRDNLAGTSTQHLPPFSARSPPHSHFHSYSPTNGTHSQPAYTNYSSRPSSSAAMAGINQSPRIGPPPSPTSNGLSHINRSTYTPRELSTSTYYDPTSEHREGQTSWNHSQYPRRSPIQVRNLYLWSLK